MSKYDVILIDADDTLLDFQAAERRALDALLIELELDTDDARHAYHTCNDACWRAIERGTLTQARLKYKRFEDFLACLGRKDDAVEVGDLYIELLSREGALMPGALEAVKAIARVRKIAIVTNGISRIQHGRMAASGLGPYIEALIISEELGVAKPDPRMIDAALEALGAVHKSRALMVGDSLVSDIGCAKNAGVDACWFNPSGVTAPEGLPIAYEIRELSALPAVALM